MGRAFHHLLEGTLINKTEMPAGERLAYALCQEAMYPSRRNSGTEEGMLLRIARKLIPCEGPIALWQALNSFQTGCLSESESLCKYALEQDPYYWATWALLCQLMAIRHDTKATYQAYQGWNFLRARHYSLRRLAIEIGTDINPADCIQQLVTETASTDAAQLSNAVGLVAFDEGNYLFSQDRFDEALIMFDVTTALRAPHAPFICLANAATHWALGDLKKAEELCLKLITIDSADWAPRELLGDIRVNQGKNREARTSYIIALNNCASTEVRSRIMSKIGNLNRRRSA